MIPHTSALSEEAGPSLSPNLPEPVCFWHDPARLGGKAGAWEMTGHIPAAELCVSHTAVTPESSSSGGSFPTLQGQFLRLLGNFGFTEH